MNDNLRDAAKDIIDLFVRAALHENTICFKVYTSNSRIGILKCSDASNETIAMLTHKDTLWSELYY